MTVRCMALFELDLVLFELISLLAVAFQLGANERSDYISRQLKYSG